MVNRVAMGQLPNGSMGLRISKPGRNVLTAGPNDLLFDTDTEMLQVVESGSRNGSGGVSWTPIGFAPIIYARANDGSVTVEYTSNNSATLISTGSGVVYWAALNIPRQI